MDLSLKEKIIDVFASLHLGQAHQGLLSSYSGYHSKYSTDEVALAVAAFFSKVEHSKEEEDGEDGCVPSYMPWVDALSAHNSHL